MKKSTKTVYWTLGIILAVALIFLGNTLGFFSTTGGFTVNSISSTKVISNDADVASANFLINAFFGGGQSITGEISSSEFEDKSGYKTVNPLSITANNLIETVNYNIQNTGQQIYSYSDTVKKSSDSCIGFTYLSTHPDAPVCPSGTWQEYDFKGAGYFSNFICERHCIQKTQAGVMGTIAQSKVTDSMDITLKVGSESITKTISSDSPSADYNSATLGYVGHINYPANGWTGNFVPDSSHFLAYYDVFGGNRWTITGTDRLTKYISAQSVTESFFTSGQSITYQGSDSQTKYNNAVADISNKLSSVNGWVLQMSSDNFAIDQSQVWGNRNDKNNGKLTIQPNRQIAVPQLNIQVRASWLGVVINVGKPKITALTCPTFKAGDDGLITATVQNIGSASGTFTTSLSCTTIVNTYNPTQFVLGAGQSTSVQIPINVGSFSGSKTDTCTVKVADFNKASNSDSSQVNCQIQPPATCQEGTISTSGNCVKKCTNGAPVNLFCCNSNQVVLQDNSKLNDQFGGYYCKDKTDSTSGSGNCAWYDLGCHFNKWFGGFFSTLGSILTIIKVIVMAIALLVVFFISKNFVGSKIIRSKKDQIFVVVIALLVSGLVGVGLYALLFSALFWIVLVGLLIFSIVTKLLLPRWL